MSGGSGGAQMPMASNRGQQQQMGMQPQMGQMPMGGMQPQMGGGQLFSPGGGQGRRFDFEGGGMGMIDQQRQAQDQFAMQLAQQAQQAQTGNMDPMGGMPMQNNQPYTAQGVPASMVDQTPFAFDEQSRAAFDQQQKMADLYGRSDGGMQPSMGAGIASLGVQMPMGQRTEMQRQQAQDLYNKSLMDQQRAGGTPSNLPGRGMPSGFRPSMGAIDGRALTNNLDITKRRQMNELPGSIQNTLPPSLKRPTQARMGLAGSVFGGKP